MYMSVQIKFHIIDKFIKFSTDVTSVLPLLTKALGIIHCNLFRIYKGFSKNNGPFFSSIYTSIYTPKLQQLQIMKSTKCAGWGCMVIGGPLSNQIFRVSPNVQTRVAALHYDVEARFR